MLADGYLCELVALLRGALRLAGGVTQGKDDRPLVEGRHVFDNLVGERSSDSGDSFMFRKHNTGTPHQQNRT